MSHGGSIPLVLCLSGHDPSGGAGLQADIEAIAANGAQACTLVTCLTLQDSCGVLEVRPVDGDWLVRQAELLFADSRFQAIKIARRSCCSPIVASRRSRSASSRISKR